jgi:hypothetical protein
LSRSLSCSSFWRSSRQNSKDQTKRTSTPRTPTPLQRAPTESDEDRIRKLLEALGQPANLKTAAARRASDRNSAPSTCAGAAADVTAFATKTRTSAQTRGNSEGNSSAAKRSEAAKKWFHPPSKFRKHSCRLSRRRSSKHPRRLTPE